MIRKGGRCLHHNFNCGLKTRLQSGRNFSTNRLEAYDPVKVRNIAVVAHIDSGKTTLTESILARSGYLSTAGTVDTGSTTTDFLPAERERGITIQSASIPVSWKEWTFNLVDTPGHADFGMEVESASRVVDGAVVLIDSVEGVEAQTQGVWRQLDRYGVSSRLLFLNKMDRTGASACSSMKSVLDYRLHSNPLLITLPVASFNPQSYASAEPGIQGIVDLVRWELWKWNGDAEETSYTRRTLPAKMEDLESDGYFPSGHPLIQELLPARKALLENLSMFSDDLLNKLLELDTDAAYASLGTDQIMPSLRAATLRNDILPTLCGSAMKHIGTDIVLDYAGLLLANPLDVSNSLSIRPNEHLQILAWKVTWDKRRGWMTFIRVYSGTLTRRTTLYNVTRNQKERLSKLLLFYASEPEEVDVINFGSIGVILGLKHTRTGDTLVSRSGHEESSTRDKRPVLPQILHTITPPPAVMSTSIVPLSNSDLEPVQEAITALTRTDPSAHLEVSEGQLLVHGLGALHLEIIENRLRDEWNVAFETGRRRVSYRERFPMVDTSIYSDSWSTDVQGKNIKANIEFSVRALTEEEESDALWSQNLVVDSDGHPIPPPEENTASHHHSDLPRANVVRGIFNALSSSPNSGLPYSHTRIELRHFELIPDTAAPSALAGAASAILRRIFLEAGLGSLMEPYVHLVVNINEESLGRLIKNLTESGGQLTEFSDQSFEHSNDEGTPYSTDGIYLPPQWLSPSASVSTEAGNHGSHMKRTVRAIAPLSQVLDFNTRLRALSGGQGSFEMASAGFRVVDDSRKLDILKELGRA